MANEDGTITGTPSRRPKGSGRTISDLITLVPQGETRLFEAGCEIVEDRFFSVRPTFKYHPQMGWHNELSFEQQPWYGSRAKPRIPIFVLPDTDVTFPGPSNKIVDFYMLAPHVHVISDRLVALIEGLDPGSLDVRKIKVKARDAVVDYNMVMPARLLEAIDADQTDVLITDEWFPVSERWYRDIVFPNGVVFRDEAVANIHNFSDVDALGWYWSRTLIEAAKVAGIKGLRTVEAGWPTGHRVDEL